MKLNMHDDIEKHNVWVKHIFQVFQYSIKNGTLNNEQTLIL